MNNDNIHHLRNSILSKCTKLTETEAIEPKSEEIEIESEADYEINDDVLRKEFSYVIDSKDISILYLDDESNNLNSFFACFRNDYNIFLAHTPEVALDILNKEKIDIVITDQKMPKITGIEFLTKVKTLYKKSPVFMILSAYVDTQLLINAINDVHVYKFLSKPYELDEIKNSISEAYSYHLSNQK
jgi:response regulator RpfG family c-di-GMP phosphodiesterase